MAKITRATIRNYKSLNKVEFDLDSFSCLIGKNNSGKSSVLEAIQLALENNKPAESDRHDSKKEIVVELTLIPSKAEEALAVGKGDSPVEELIEAGQGLTFILQSKCEEAFKLVEPDLDFPPEHCFSKQSFKKLVKEGKTSEGILKLIEERMPEAKEYFEEKSPKKQGDFTTIHADFLASEPAGCKETFTKASATKTDAFQLLKPTVIYIPAVRDVNAETSGASSSLGKILDLTLKEKTSSFSGIQSQLDTAIDALNGTGVVKNQEIADLESEVMKELSDTFPGHGVEFSIPKFNLNEVLKRANMKITNGGTEYPLESQGSGLQRNLIFSLIMAYARKKESLSSDDKIVDAVLMFEEPEVFLHPSAQRKIFQTLRKHSESLQVLVTTHSASFIPERESDQFLKVVLGNGAAAKPEAKIASIGLQEDDFGNAFRLLKYENQEAGFFADTVVLVEGITDVAALRHVASELGYSNEGNEGETVFIAIGGKGDFERYQNFFESFNTRVIVQGDLDCLDGNLRNIKCSDDARASVTALLEKARTTGEATAKKIKREWKNLAEKVEPIFLELVEGTTVNESHVAVFDELKAALEPSDQTIAKLKTDAYQNDLDSTLSLLRKEGIFLWSKGAIEDSYPSEITGKTKTKKCEAFTSLSGKTEVQGNSEIINFQGKSMTEMEAICVAAYGEK